jgi:hypothetical protein
MLHGFQFCDQLVRIEIPASVELIYALAFWNCTSLREVIFPSDSHLKILGGFRCCRQLFKIEIPASVEVIEDKAFSPADSLHAVVFAPGSHIREVSGFRDCESLSRIEFQSDSIIPNSTFFMRNQKCLVFRKRSNELSMLFDVDSDYHMIDEPLIDIGEMPENEGESESESERAIVSIDYEARKISKISDRLFCLYLMRSIEIPSCIQSIGSCLRSVEMRIPMVVIPSSIEKVDGFCGFHSIEFVRFAIGSCVREIRGFHWCESLHRIEIPASAEILVGFHSCDSLTEVIFESGSRIREIRGFHWCKSLDRIEIPASAEFISGFNFCNSLTIVVFEEVSRVRNIKAFHKCKSLSKIEIPASVLSIEDLDDRFISQLIFGEGTMINTIEIRDCRGGGTRGHLFVGYGERDLKTSRRRFNLIRRKVYE